MFEAQPSKEVTLAHTIDGATRSSKCGRTKVYDEIRKGRLRARKIGRRTIILDADLKDWLASLPTREAMAKGTR